MDFNKLTTRFIQFGGYRLILDYIKIGALWPGLKAFFRCWIKRQSFKSIYPEVLKKVEPFLIRKYGTHIPQRIKTNKNLTKNTKKVIWFCWLQGIDQAPEIIHACYNSIRRNLPDREVKVIENENWKEYVELPEFIVKKWEKKRIPVALFSDLLRLELLIKYGGTWIDSTVLCTGVKCHEYLDADLFLFQYTRLGSIPVSISNWFITACSNNEVLMVLRNMLHAYWKDYDCTLDYYIFHLFFSVLSKEYPEAILAMPYGQSMNSLILTKHWNEQFDQNNWNKLTEMVCFHKLAFRIDEKVKLIKGNYYNHILSEYGRI